MILIPHVDTGKSQGCLSVRVDPVNDEVAPPRQSQVRLQYGEEHGH